jgi:hypothetical protein
MAKFLGTLLITLLLAVTASPQRKTTDLESESLKGPVHFVTSESSSSLTVGSLTDKGPNKKLDSLTFDAQGLLIERVIYDDYGFLVGTEKYSHDAAGHMLTAELVDEKGHPQDKQTYTFGPQGRLQEIVFADEKGTASLRQVYLYDQQGHLAAEVYYDPKNTIGKTVFQTDARGYPLEAAFFLADGSKSSASMGPCYSVHKVKYTYDSQGRVIEETGFLTDGSVKRKSTYRYDEKGQVAEEVRTGNLSILTYVHQYEYDQQGNWTTHTTKLHSSREPLFNETRDEADSTTIRTRKITYF